MTALQSRCSKSPHVGHQSLCNHYVHVGVHCTLENDELAFVDPANVCFALRSHLTSATSLTGVTRASSRPTRSSRPSCRARRSHVTPRKRPPTPSCRPTNSSTVSDAGVSGRTLFPRAHDDCMRSLAIHSYTQHQLHLFAN